MSKSQLDWLGRYFWPRRHGTLLWQFARREVLGRYRGSLLGVGWSFVTPLLNLAVYTFVFVGVFKARWPGAEQGGGLEFGLQLFAGLMVFNLFAELATRAPRLVLDQPNLVKKVVFPLEILPWVTVLAGFFHLLLSLLVLVAATAVVRGTVPSTAIALPLVLFPFLPFLLGVGWLFAALGVFLRDVSQMMGLAVSLTMFLSPVFYSTQALSDSLRQLMQLNPLTLIIESTRNILLQSVWPDWQALLFYLVLASLFAALSAVFFELTRKGFADVL